MSTMIVDDKLWMSMADAARRIGCTRGRVTQLADSRQLRTVVAFGRRYVSRADVERYASEPQTMGRPRKFST